MRNLLLVLLILIPIDVFADAFAPEFNKMKTLRCDFEETVYNKDNSVVSTSKQFRVFKLDDEYQKIYLQKEPIDRVFYYGDGRIEFNLQSMTDDVIIMSNTVINRNTMQYRSTSEITYDNFMFGTRKSRSVGACRFID